MAGMIASGIIITSILHLIPPMRWIDNEKPWPPIVGKEIVGDSVLKLSVRPDPRNDREIKYYVIYKYALESHTELFGNVPKYISQFIMQPAGFEYSDTAFLQPVFLSLRRYCRRKKQQ